MKIDDWFIVDHPGHFAHGRYFRCVGLPRIRLRGYDATMDLGKLIEFVIDEADPRNSRHVLPEEWCRRLAEPPLPPRARVLTQLKAGRKRGKKLSPRAPAK